MANISKIMYGLYSEIPYDQTLYDGKITVGKPMSVTVNNYKAYAVTTVVNNIYESYTFHINLYNSVATAVSNGIDIINGDGKDLRGDVISANEIHGFLLENGTDGLVNINMHGLSGDYLGTAKCGANGFIMQSPISFPDVTRYTISVAPTSANPPDTGINITVLYS